MTGSLRFEITRAGNWAVKTKQAFGDELDLGTGKGGQLAALVFPPITGCLYPLRRPRHPQPEALLVLHALG